MSADTSAVSTVTDDDGTSRAARTPPHEHEGTTPAMTQPRQPLLHDSVVVLTAPSQAWSAADGHIDGRIDGHGIHGFYHSDLRVLDRVVLTVGGVDPEHIATARPDAATASFTSLARGIDDATADPRVRVDRTRTVRAGVLAERIVLRNALGGRIRTVVEVALGADFTPMQQIKAGLTGSEHPVVVETDGAAGAVLRSGRVTARVAAAGAEVTVAGDAVTVRWKVDVPAHDEVALEWRAEVDDPTAVVGGAQPSEAGAAFRAETGD